MSRAQLFNLLVDAVDASGACSFPKAENSAESNNGWSKLVDAVFGPNQFGSSKYKTPTAGEKVSNFKDKIVNKVWLEFEDKIKGKSEQDLTSHEKMCRNHIRLYRKALQDSKNKAESKAANHRNSERIELAMGMTPARGTTPNTSLHLEPIPQGGGQSSMAATASASAAASARRGVGGYLSYGPSTGASTFEDILCATSTGLLGPLIGGLATTSGEAAAVTPFAPPVKSARIARLFEFKREKYTTQIIATKNTQTMQDLKRICAKKAEDRVFKLDSVDVAALKSKLKVFMVVIGGGEIEQEYNDVKGLTVDEILGLLSAENSHSNCITLEFKMKDANIGGDINMNGLETYESE